ncbi:MAG TPA: AAA family ATPase [Ktedonobacteraceae bacterium]|nr:AAA family ATPase [Ktedonobacteraceae bacterium]
MEQRTVRLPSHLSGRQDELARLWHQFEQTTVGRFHAILLAGDPGIGKTSLLEAIAGRAEQVGALVLRGGAFQADGMPPYQSFLEALGSYIRTASPAHLREVAGPMASVLATIFPELFVALGEVLPSYPLPAEQARLRLFEAVSMFLAGLASTVPLVLVLDDLQWADSASLDLLRHVVRQQSTARFLILGAYRGDELANNPALERVLLDLNRTRLLTLLSLGPLTEQEIAEVASAYLNIPVDPGLARLLFMHSEGNPFFAEELLRAWEEAGALAVRNELLTQVGRLPNILPSGIVGVVQQRLARLPDATVEALRTAALLGRSFEVARLCEVQGSNEVESIDEALSAAVVAGLLWEDETGILTFRHDKVRECLMASLPPLRRRRLHGFIGRILEAQTEPPGSAQQLADLAFHFTRSGDRTRGAHYACRAAEQALVTCAPQEALKYYRVALDLLSPQGSEWGSLLLCLGEAAILAGKEQEALTAFEETQNWFLKRGDRISAARAAHGMGRVFSQLEAHAKALTALETARTWLQDHPCAELVLVLSDLATLLAVSLGRQREGITYGKQALALAEKLEDHHLQTTANRTVGNLLMRVNQLEEAIPLLERALTQAQTMDDASEACECCACLTLAHVWSGHMKQGKAITDERLAWARRTGEPYQMRHIYSLLAMFPLEQGRLIEAQHWLAQAEAALADLSSPEPHAFLSHCRGWLAYYRGDYAVAEEHFAQAVDLLRALGASVLVWYLPPLGLAQARLGKQQAAISCLDEVEGLLEYEQDHSIAKADAFSKLTQIALVLDDRPRLSTYYQALLPFQGRFVDVFVDRLLGEIETLLLAWEQAHAHLSTAEAMAQREDLVPERAWVLVAWSKLALAQGGRGSAAQARQLFEQALTLFQGTEMSGEVQALQDRLMRMPKKASLHPPHTLPAGLSLREVEVLRLIVTGKSNRQIAEDLVLSEKTVANHVLHIFNKTGTQNRTAAATFALRHGLA